MGKSFAKAQMEGNMSVLKTWNKLDAIKYLIPQKLKDNKLINVNGLIVGTWVGDDQELFPAKRLLEATKVTDALVRDVTANLKKLLAEGGEDEPQEDVEDEAPEAVESEDEAEESEEEVTPSPKKLLKELKKELKGLEKGTKEYKKLKKQIKKLKA